MRSFGRPVKYESLEKNGYSNSHDVYVMQQGIKLTYLFAFETKD